MISIEKSTKTTHVRTLKTGSAYLGKKAIFISSLKRAYMMRDVDNAVTNQ